MKTNNQQGKTLSVIVGMYLFVKLILNMIIGKGFDFTGLVGDIIMFVALFSGMQYLNYAVSAVLAIVIITHLPANIANIGSNWIYLVEAVVDAVCIFFLCTNAAIKEHFTNKWSEISSLFK